MSNDFEKYNKKTLAGVAKDAEAFAIRICLQKRIGTSSVF